MSISPRTKLRLLGIFPLIFFFAQAAHYWPINELGNLFWMCNLGNVLLAFGLFLEKPVVTRLAAIWMIPGLFIWILYVVLAWGIFLSSTLAHVGGLAVAAEMTWVARKSKWEGARTFGGSGAFIGA